MKIALIVLGNSRRNDYLNGETLRYGGCGGSGTDSSSIVMAEYLAKLGHEVVFAFDKLESYFDKKLFTPGSIVNGVQYTFRDSFEGIKDLNFDVLITSLWFKEYLQLPIKVSKALIYWSHMQWVYGVDEIVNFVKSNDLKFFFVNISPWQKAMVKKYLTYFEVNLPCFKEVTIPNPVLSDIVEEVNKLNISKKPHKFIFHASWARGGNVAYEVVKKLPYENKEFHAFDYLMTIHDHKDSFFKAHNSVDKLSLFKHLAESEYFIYPLYTPYDDVHKDTFSCVVAEAIALDCIVLTYPLGALPDYFEEYCVWVKFPDALSDEDIKKIQNEPLTKDTKKIFKNNENSFIEKIIYLENNLDIKNKYKKGQKYIVENFNIEKIGKKWSNLMDLI